MNSNQWDKLGYKKHTNASGEVIRVKEYVRILPAWDNVSVENLVSSRMKLADMLGVNYRDLLADLEITVKISRYPKHKRFLKFLDIFKED